MALVDVPNWTADEVREHRLQWIEALESGGYEQARKALIETAGAGEGVERKLCCLGVACEVALPDLGPDAKWDDSEFLDGFLDADYEDPRPYSTDSELTYGVAAWMDVEDLDPKLDGRTAVQRNDEDGEGFEEIAAAARREWGLVGAVSAKKAAGEGMS